MENGNEQSRTSIVIPSLITICNAVCGFIALTLIAGSLEGSEIPKLTQLNKAAWFILCGMLFDVFDGRIARATGSSSSIGAHLDSLSDLVTFGLAPAGLSLALYHASVSGSAIEKLVWLFGLAYFLGALLRLARFNAEHDPDEGEDGHLAFKGMPTPGAAGVVAGLVLVYFWLDQWQSWELRLISAEKPESVSQIVEMIPHFLPYVCFLLGYSMVSNRLVYPHVGSRFFTRGQSFDVFVSVVFGGTLIVFFVEPVVCISFMIYMLLPILRPALRLITSRSSKGTS